MMIKEDQKERRISYASSTEVGQILIEFLEWVFQNPPWIEFFFRGHARREWKMAPGIGRPLVFRDKELYQGFRNLSDPAWFEQRIFDRFESASIRYLRFDNACFLDRLAVAQNYGVPTRLLDWTTSPLIAMFMAINNEREFSEMHQTAVVWRTSTSNISVMSDHSKYSSIISLIDGDLKMDCPRMFRPSNIDDRVWNQHSIMMCGPLVAEPDDGEKDIVHLVYKIRGLEGFSFEINSEGSRELIQRLFQFGINQSFVFPGLHSIGMDIRRMFESNPLKIV